MKIPVEWAGDEMFAEDQSKDEFIRNYMRESKQTRIVSEHDDKKTDKFSRERKGKDRPAAALRSDKKDFKKTPEKREERENRAKKPYTETKPKSAAGKVSYDKTKHKNENAAETMKERPSKNLSLDKRMDYYKERYGEDFTVKREITAGPAKNTKKEKKPFVKRDKKGFENAPVKKTSLLSRIKSIFKKK